VVRAIGHRNWLRLSRRSRRLDESALRALSPLLILSPHQDDETLGCGGLIATARRLGLSTRVTFLTDGSASHKGSAAWPPTRLAHVRRREALDALSVLGVEPQDCLFLDWSDAAPLARDDPDYARTLDRLAEWAAERPPRSLWSPWRGEAHCDHVAASQLAGDVLSRLPSVSTRMEFLVWGWKERHACFDGRSVWSLACPDTVERRRQALACHRTQMTDVIDDALSAFQIPAALAALTDRPVEIYLEAE